MARESKKSIGPARTVQITITDFFQIENVERFQMVGSAWASYGSGNNNLNYPHGLAVLPPGGTEVWVADTQNNRIARFDSDGVWQGSFGSVGTGNGEFQVPRDLAISAAGYCYVADFDNDRIQRFNSSTYAYDSQWSTGANSEPNGVYYDEINARVYVACYNGQAIKVYSTTGTLLDTWTLTYRPLDVAVSADGQHVFVSSNTALIRYNNAGNMDGTVGELNMPVVADKYVGVDTAGHVYALDGGGKGSILKFMKDGTFISAFGSNGTGNVQWTQCKGFVRFERYVYVSDWGGHRILKLRPTYRGNGTVFKIDNDGRIQYTGNLVQADVDSIVSA